jgi:ribonuclease HI
MDTPALRAAEEELLTSRTRRDPSRVRELLHPDFVEIGRTGRRWTRDEIVVALANEDDRDAVVTDEWMFSDLAPGLALVTYVIRGAREDSRHSSIWCENDGQLQMRFHQGTFVTHSQRHS